MLPYFTGSQTVLQQLSQLDEPEQAILMARAVWRSLQLLPALKTCWSCSLLYSIMLHKVCMCVSAMTNTFCNLNNYCEKLSLGWPNLLLLNMGLLNSRVLSVNVWSIGAQVPEVRWYAVHCVAIITKLVSLASMSPCGTWLLNHVVHQAIKL